MPKRLSFLKTLTESPSDGVDVEDSDFTDSYSSESDFSDVEGPSHDKGITMCTKVTDSNIYSLPSHSYQELMDIYTPTSQSLMYVNGIPVMRACAIHSSVLSRQKNTHCTIDHIDTDTMNFVAEFLFRYHYIHIRNIPLRAVDHSVHDMCTRYNDKFIKTAITRFQTSDSYKILEAFIHLGIDAGIYIYTKTKSFMSTKDIQEKLKLNPNASTAEMSKKYFS